MKMLNTADKKMTAMRNHSTIHYTAFSIAREINRGQAILDRIETVLTQINSETGLRNFAKIDSAVIDQYVTYLYEKVENEELSRTTAANYISALNTALRYADKGDLVVSAKDVGLSRGNFVPTDRSVSGQQHQAFLEYLKLHPDTQSAALAKSVEIQRLFGLRARESFAIKEQTIKNALSTGVLRLTKADLPKNSRARDIQIVSQNQKDVLKEIYDFMRANGYNSLIPPDQSLRQHSGWAYRQVDSFRKESQAENYHFHGERHSYAHARYEQLWAEKTGTAIKPPVLVSADRNRHEWKKYAAKETGLSLSQLKEIDTAVRSTVSNELGHARIGITRAYLG